MVQLRKVLAVVVPVGVSTTITVLIGALLPAQAGFTLFVGGLAVAVALALGVREDLAAAALLRARRLTPGEEVALAPAVTLLCRSGWGPPLIYLWVRPDLAHVAASGAGRATVVLSGGLVNAVRDGALPAEEAAAVIAHPASLVRAGLTRMDLLLGFWTLPWRLLQGLTAVTALSYAAPSWRRRWERQLQRAGDDMVRHAGFGPALARFLQRLPRTPALRDRIADLDPGVQAPSLGLVTWTGPRGGTDPGQRPR